MGALTQHVEARLKGELCLPFAEEGNEAFQAVVEDLVSRLLETGDDIHTKGPKRHFINVAEITHSMTRTVGGERFLMQVLNQIGLPDLLQELGFNQRNIQLACALLIGRALSPGSECHTLDWMCNESSILELMDLDPPCDQMLHRAVE